MVFLKILNFLRARRQPQKVEIQPPQEHDARGFRLWCQSVFFALSRNESIQWIPHPLRTSHAWNLRAHTLAKRPVFLRIYLGFFIHRRRRTGCDPLTQHLHLHRGKRFTLVHGWHPFIGVRFRDTFNDDALCRVARYHRLPGLTAFLHQCDRIQTQPGLLFERPVTCITTFSQQGLDVPLIIRRPASHARSKQHHRGISQREKGADPNAAQPPL